MDFFRFSLHFLLCAGVEVYFKRSRSVPEALARSALGAKEESKIIKGIPTKIKMSFKLAS
ncbi:MAG: hypothetical protein EA343_09180 [Nodularia sp. (in: Bacteria)]|nr:MAG: hypothetical protein EA343_09180 [Nodularia sp. (in: cyanobacteria)]